MSAPRLIEMPPRAPLAHHPACAHRVVRAAIVLTVALINVGCDTDPSVFPSKSITIVVPWSAGGGTDGLARAIAKEATDVLGVSVNVLNKTGGQGMIGHLHGMRAFPDGYTLTMITFELATYKALGRSHVEVAGFQPLLQLNEDPSAITVRADAPYKTLGDFLDAARANPERITIGNSGPGSVWHLAALRLQDAAGVEIAHIPFDGAAPAVVQVLGGHIDAVSVSPAEVIQHVQVGRLRILGVMADQRDPAVPDVPTMREQGVDVVFGAWRGLALPAGTPDDVVATLRDGFKQAYDTAGFRDAAAAAKLGLSYLDTDAFTAALIEREAAAAKLVGNAVSQNPSTIDFLLGRGLVPTIAGVAFVVLAIALAATARKKAPSAKPTPPPSVKHNGVASALAGLVAYWAAMHWLGYIGPTLAFMLYLQWVVMADRRRVRVVASSVVVTAAIYLAFGQILNVPLPAI